MRRPDPEPPRRRRGGLILVLVLVLLVGGAGAAAMMWRDGGELQAALEDAETAGAGGDAAGEPAAALDPAAAPGEVFDHASAVLDDVGTFSYEAAVRVEVSGDQDAFGPIVVDQDLVGDVVLPDSVHETVESSEGFHRERIATGVGVAAQVWRRETAFDGQLDARPWGEDFPWPGELDPYRMPEWLDDVTGARDGGEDGSGRRVVSGDVPVAVVGEGPDLEVISSAVELSVTDDGAPRRVLLEVATREVVIEADYALSGLGDELAIDPPAEDALDPTPWFNEGDLDAFEGPTPQGLTGIPQGWDVSGAYVQPAGLFGCARATVEYQDLRDPVAAFLWIETLPADCAPSPRGGAFEVAGFAGSVAERDDGSRWGVVVSGDTAVSFETDLPLGDLEVVLATLAPLDLAAVPEPLAGIPSDGV